MTSDLIGIENDKSQIIIDRSSKKLSEKGVILHDQDETTDSIKLTYIGLANRRKGSYSTPLLSLKDLSEEQIDTKVNEIVSQVSAILMAGGEKSDD